MKKLLILFTFFLFGLFGFSNVQAQSCGGSYQCCSGSIQMSCNCPVDINNICACGFTQICSGTITSRSCSNSLNCSPYDIPNPCDGGAVMSATCYSSGTCPSGTNFCGGVLQTCCPNTQTCNEWIAAGSCSGVDPDPGDPPISPPDCTPKSGGWTNNRPNFSFVQTPNGGENWDQTEGRYFLRTNNNDGQIKISWTTPAANIDTIQYRFFPWDTNTNMPAADTHGNVNCDNSQAHCGTLAGNSTEYSFRPRRNLYYRLRVRFRHNCQGRWSAWQTQDVRIDGQVTGRVFVLSGNQSAAPTGLNGTCVSNDGTAFTNYPGSVSVTGEGYSSIDTILNATSARFRTYLPYLNPGAVTLSIAGVPSGYTVACPVGGAYNPGNSSIPAPYLDSGFNGNVVDANFYLCASGAAPVAPTISTPAAAPVKTTPILESGQYRVRITFQKTVTSTIEYRVIPTSVYGTVPEASECAQAGVTCDSGGVGSATYSSYFVPTTSDYVIKARTAITACGEIQASPWITRSISVWNNIQGSVFQDLAGTCSVGSNLVAGGSVSLTNTLPFSQTITNSGTPFSLSVPWGSGNTTATFNNGGITLCSCPTPLDPTIGCQRFGLSSVTNHTGVDFFATKVSDSWWQVSGGPIMALGKIGQVVQSFIPDSALEPYLITHGNGYVVTGSGDGSVDLKSDPGVQDDFIDDGGLNIVASATPTRETFDTFVRRYKFPQTRQNDFDGQSGRPSASNATEPSHTPLNGVAAYYSTGATVVNSAWNVGAGETVVVFVEGDLDFGPAATTTVAPGGFLAFIVSGNITFSPDIGSNTASSVTPVMQGLFVADGSVRFPTRAGGGVADRKFVGAGTFVGWQDIEIERTFNDGAGGGINNNLYPATLFIYRPDFLLNAPSQFRAPRYQWQEIAP